MVPGEAGLSSIRSALWAHSLAAVIVVAALCGDVHAMEPLKVIYDTDMCGDCDDAGALATLHVFADCDDVELLGICVYGDRHGSLLGCDRGRRPYVRSLAFPPERDRGWPAPLPDAEDAG